MATIVPEELEWDRAPARSAALIDFILQDGGSEFLAYDFAKVFDPENTNPIDIRGAKNLYMGLYHNDFEAVRVAVETGNEDIYNHLIRGLDIIGQYHPDFLMDANDAIAQVQNPQAIEPDPAPEPQEQDTPDVSEEFSLNIEELAAMEVNQRASDYFIEFTNNIDNDEITVAQRVGGLTVQSFLENYLTQMREGSLAPDEVFGTLVANDFAMIDNIADRVDPALNSTLMDIVRHIDNELPGAAQALIDASEDYSDIVDFQRNIQLTDFVQNNIAAMEEGSIDAADYLGNLIQYLDTGIYQPEFLQDAFLHNDAEFIQYLTGLENQEVNEALFEVLKKLGEESPEFIDSIRGISNEIDRAFAIDAIPGMSPQDLLAPDIASGAFLGLQHILEHREESELRAYLEEAVAQEKVQELLTNETFLEIMRDATNAQKYLIAEVFEPELDVGFIADFKAANPILGPLFHDFAPPGDDFSVPGPAATDDADTDNADTADASDDSATVEPEEVEPLPGAAALQGLIRPNISHAPEITFDQAQSMIGELQERLDNLPDDPEARQAALNDISQSLEEIAIGLSPTIAGDARLEGLPPLSTNPGDVDAQIGRLGVLLDSAEMQTTHSELIERLVQSSQQAGIAARSIDYISAPDADADAQEPVNEGFTVIDNNEPRDPNNAATYGITPESGLVDNPDVNGGNNIAPEGNDNPDGDYSDVMRPDSVNPENAATYGITPDHGLVDEAPTAADDDVGAQDPDGHHNADDEIVTERMQESPPVRPSDLLAENRDSIMQPAAGDDVSQEADITRPRLSELLDGRGFHNDTDGYTDFDAMMDAFNRAAQLNITTPQIEAIRDVLNSPDFILKTSAAIEALTAHNQAGNEIAGLEAFFGALSPEDFVRDREGVRDDHSVYDSAERDAVRNETINLENSMLPKP